MPQSPFSQFIIDQSLSGRYPGGPGTNTGEGFNPPGNLADYLKTLGIEPGTVSAAPWMNGGPQTDAYKQWQVQQLLGGRTPTQYWKNAFPGWDGSGSPSFDPATGMVNYKTDYGGDFMESLAPMLATAAVGGLSGGFGLGNMFGSGGSIWDAARTIGSQMAGAGAGAAAGSQWETPFKGRMYFGDTPIGDSGAGADMGGGNGGGSDAIGGSGANKMDIGSIFDSNVDPFQWAAQNPGAASQTGYFPGMSNAADYYGLSGIAGPAAAGGGLFSGLSGSDIFKGLTSLPGLLGGLGALAGGLGANAKPAGQITTVNDIPEWLKPYVIGNLNSATTRAAQLSGQTPLLDPAQAELGKTISGAYLNPASNPYLQSTYDQASKAVTDSYLSATQPRTDALFYNSGAFGPSNSAYAETVARNKFGLGQNLQNLATNIFGGNYNQERSRQFGAASAAPDFTTSYYQGAFSPFSAYKGLTAGLGSTQSQPYFNNPLGGALSGALAGFGLGKVFGS